MSVQTEVEIGKNLTFYFLAKTPATDVIADTDAAPAYRIYEEETGTPILTGNMAKLDDAGTLGFYSEQIAASVGNGFEADKSYAIHIAAAISAAAIAEESSFRARPPIEDKVWDEPLTGSTHNDATSAGRRIRQLGDAIGGAVDDAAASAMDFDTDLAGNFVDNHFNDQNILFTTGNLAGQVKGILAYVDATGNISMDEAFTEAPANGDEFDILPQHTHPISQIAASTNAEMVDALSVDTYAEPGQEAPGATVSLATKIGYGYKRLRNRRTQTATEEQTFADDGTTVDQKRTVSDDGTTFDAGEIETGP